MARVKRDNVIDAINNGINSSTIKQTLLLLDEKYGNMEYVPKQYMMVIEDICNLKNVPGASNNNYSSTYFKSNGHKLDSAINDGISKEEIISFFSNNELNNSNHMLMFISGIKGIEKKNSVTNERGYQKVLEKKES